MALFNNLPEKKYKTLVIDPPWEMKFSGQCHKQGRPNRVMVLPYETLTLDEIKSFPLAQVAETGAHVYCWTTNKLLPFTFSVLEAWGCRYHLTMPLLKKSGIAPCNGYVFGSEFCLLSFFGRPMQKFTSIGKLNWLITNPKAGKHSVKPDDFYSLVETMSPSPRVDLFARKERAGWHGAMN